MKGNSPSRKSGSWVWALFSKAVSPRSTLPVLANVLIASDEGRLRLSATNLEMGITCWIRRGIDEEGQRPCPLERLRSVSSIAKRSGLLEARCGNSNIERTRRHLDERHQCIDAQEFPPWPVPDFEGGGADQRRAISVR